ncbi:MAG: family 78 glycoside hydrolase catalytic domain [Bacteroidaceae bacterium]|nr:family 78 glycoside hydrolase catalytic domain [Bacteroidaceae bacterium]
MNMKTIAFAASLLFALNMSAGNDVAKLTEPLKDEAWDCSVWISVVDAPVVKGVVNDGTRAADGANWFVSDVKNEKKVVSAKWMTAGLGVYDLYINGKLVGQEVLKPGFTHPFKTKRSFTYDVTKLMVTKAGAENQLSVQVTPGWWGDKIVTPGATRGMFGTKCAFRGVLELTYTDGSKKLYGTDTKTWKAGIAGPVKHAAIFDGEVYDARVKQGYETPELLSTPEENNEFRGQIFPTNGAEIYMREDLTLQPVRTYIWEGVEGASNNAFGKVIIKKEYKKGEPVMLRKGETLVVDFGQNCSAVPSFVFSAKEGTQLMILPSELLNDGNGSKKRGMDGPEGSVHRLNLRIPDTGMQLEYTFSGDKKPATFRPQNTFFGYRLISITATDDVIFKSITSVPVTSISKEMEIGTITTGNELVNKLISNTLWGQRSNYLSVPTDCPQRNERLGWTADTQVFTETGTFFANTDHFFHKWMQDMRDTQSPTGAFPGVAPLAQYGAGDGKGNGDMMRLGWADAGIIVPWTVWKQFGDRSIVEENWESMNRFMNHIYETKYEHTAMTSENGNYQWADWLSYEPLESCSGRSHENGQPKPETIDYWNYLSASYWAIDAGMMCDMARATERDAAPYEKMLSEAKDYIRGKFLNTDGTFKTEILNTMQTPALFALKNQLVSGAAKDAMLARLRQNFADHGNCLQTGFLGTSILMQTLTENGMSDIAYELLFQRKNPSWLYSIDNGATTIWERWNSYMKDSGMGPRGMNSFNHYAYGCVCEWIWETVAGIAADPKQPGFKHIIMRPVPDKRLGFLNAEYKSSAGTIKSSWKYQGDKWIWKFTIPEGATATVILPGETSSKEYAAGSYTLIEN